MRDLLDWKNQPSKNVLKFQQGYTKNYVVTTYYDSCDTLNSLDGSELTSK